MSSYPAFLLVLYDMFFFDPCCTEMGSWWCIYFLDLFPPVLLINDHKITYEIWQMEINCFFINSIDCHSSEMCNNYLIHLPFESRIKLWPPKQTQYLCILICCRTKYGRIPNKQNSIDAKHGKRCHFIVYRFICYYQLSTHERLFDWGRNNTYSSVGYGFLKSCISLIIIIY